MSIVSVESPKNILISGEQITFIVHSLALNLGMLDENAAGKTVDLRLHIRHKGKNAIELNIDPDLKMPEIRIYLGEPFAEALSDIILIGGIPISHQLSRASATERTDVFKLPDNMILAVASASPRLGACPRIRMRPKGCGGAWASASLARLPLLGDESNKICDKKDCK
jgi:hypothetical protein